MADDLDQLVARALALEDREGADYHGLVYDLQQRGDRATLERAIALSSDPSEWGQRLGIDVLGQIGFVEQALPAVLARCGPDGSPDLLRDALLALGQIGDRRGLETALSYLRHPDSDVRFGVIHALDGIAGEYAGEAVVEAAIELTRDPDDDVRNWATFVLGLSFEEDTPQIRDALAARIDDSDANTRAEALAGLVARSDPRASDPVVAWFSGAAHEDDDDYTRDLMVETAARLADPRCLEGLRALHEGEPENPFGGWIEVAMATCSGEPFPELEDVR